MTRYSNKKTSNNYALARAKYTAIFAPMPTNRFPMTLNLLSILSMAHLNNKTKLRDSPAPIIIIISMLIIIDHSTEAQLALGSAMTPPSKMLKLQKRQQQKSLGTWRATNPAINLIWYEWRTMVWAITVKTTDSTYCNKPNKNTNRFSKPEWK